MTDIVVLIVVLRLIVVPLWTIWSLFIYLFFLVTSSRGTQVVFTIDWQVVDDAMCNVMVTTVLESPGMSWDLLLSWDLLFVLEFTICPGMSLNF